MEPDVSSSPTMSMIRVPSSGGLSGLLSKARSTGDLHTLTATTPPAPAHASILSDASSMLTATATIVAASATIADSAHSTASLIGAVASMIGASASLIAATVPAVRSSPAPEMEIVEIEAKVGFESGVLIGGVPALQARQFRRRLDVTIIAGVDQQFSIGHCEWDAAGPGGVYVNGKTEAEYFRGRYINVIDMSVVGQGRFNADCRQG